MPPERELIPSPFTAAHRRPGRAPLPSRAASAAQAPLLRCMAGPHALLFDLRTLRHIDFGLLRARGPLAGESALDRAAAAPLLHAEAQQGPVPEVDLRQVLGVPCGPEQALLYSLRGEAHLRRLIVDAASLRLLRVDLARIVPLPPLLGRLPALRAARAVVELDDGLGWLLDPARLGAA